MKNLLIENCDIVLPDKVAENFSIYVENAKIKEISKERLHIKNAEICNGNGNYLLAGFVDIHLHGGGGYDFMDGDEEAFEKIVAIHFSHGTTSLCPTAVSAPISQLEKFFAGYRKVSEKKTGANLCGIHLEGPFISQEMRGAQNPEYILPPDRETVDKIYDLGGDIISRITASPNLDGIGYLVKKFGKGTEFSVGHSDAVCSDVKKAVDLGFDCITHLYCNTPSCRKINQKVYAGVLEAAYLYDGLNVELIGDGKHVAKEAMQLALKIKGADKVALVTDAMRAAGTDAKESYLGAKLPENRVIIEDGVAKLPDRSFYAGSIATADRMLKNAVLNYGIDIVTASRMLSRTPAHIIGIDDKKGSIETGKDADLVMLDKDYNVIKVFSGGFYRN